MTTPTTQETPETVPADQVGTETPPGASEPSQGEPEGSTEQVEREDQETPEPEPADTDDQGADPLKTARGEAARHRREKQEALARATAAESALEQSRKAHAESLLPDGALYQRGDLWFDGATIDRVLDESGNVSRELDRALADEQVAARPGLGKGTTPGHRAGGGYANGYARETGGVAKTSDGWDAYDEEQRAISSWDDAAQSTRVGQLKSGEQLRRIVDR